MKKYDQPATLALVDLAAVVGGVEAMYGHSMYLGGGKYAYSPNPMSVPYRLVGDPSPWVCNEP
jgi:hypothetical protein